VQHSARVREERSPRIGQPYAPPEPVEEPCPHLILELRNLLRERRLRDMATLSGAAKAACIHNGAQVTQLMKFHR
jgi:hypothetical protein